MRISDWSSDVCSSDLPAGRNRGPGQPRRAANGRYLNHRAAGGCSVIQECAVLVKGRAFSSARQARRGRLRPPPDRPQDRKSVVEGKSVYVRVAIGGRRTIKKKKQNSTNQQQPN